MKQSFLQLGVCAAGPVEHSGVVRIDSLSSGNQRRRWTLIIHKPLLVFRCSFAGLWLAAWLGARLKRWKPLGEELRPDFSLILAAMLTLLGLLIGFRFSMAGNRYDQRKNYEERRPTPSGRNMSGPICCLPPMRRRSATC